MTKDDYKLIVKGIRRCYALEHNRRFLINTFSKIFKKNSPKFSKEAFEKECLTGCKG